MREKFTEQMPLTPQYAQHPRSRELEQISKILDQYPELAQRVAEDQDDALQGAAVAGRRTRSEGQRHRESDVREACTHPADHDAPEWMAGQRER